jgi:hypothetical protein
MRYQKINVELIVFEEEADRVVEGLNLALDQLEETYTSFGGGFEIRSVERSGTRRKSALRHTLDARDTATSAVKLGGSKGRRGLQENHLAALAHELRQTSRPRTRGKSQGPAHTLRMREPHRQRYSLGSADRLLLDRRNGLTQTPQGHLLFRL